MKIYSVLLSAAALIPFSRAVDVCNTDPCEFDIQEGGSYACGCGVKCDIDITDTNGKEITLYTFGKTKIRCLDTDSCQGATILAGISPPPDSEQPDTSCTPAVTAKVKIDCEASTSCKDMNVTSNGIDVKVKALEIDSFDEGILDCYGITCDLFCSSSVESCSQAKCDTGCSCSGAYCPGFTSSPTKNPAIEQPDIITPPEPETTATPEYVTCEGKTNANGVCKLSPEENEIVVVSRKDGVKTLEIKCNKQQQCKNMKIFSAANTTEVRCGKGYQACYDAVINVGNIDLDDIPATYDATDFPNEVYNTVLVDCDGEDACKQMNVTIKGTFANNPLIMAMGDGSFSDGCVDCQTIGVECKLMCNNDVSQACMESQCKNNCLQAGMSANPPQTGTGTVRVGHRTGGSTVVLGTEKATVILDKNNGVCEIDCKNKDQCTKIEIYSGCNTTIIDCGEAACEKGKFYIGALVDNVPNGKTAADFAGNKKTVIINCNNYKACSEVEIKLVGVFSNGAEVNALMPNGLYKGNLESLTTDVIVNCDNGDGCADLRITCAQENNCLCDGGSCTSLDTNSNNAVTNTPAPTIPTISPTNKPTANPTKKPTLNPTSAELIVYTPAQSGVFICKNNVKTCVLDCNNAASQCDQGVVLLSAANVTKVLCEKSDSCKEIELLFGNAVNNGALNRHNVEDCTPSDFINGAARSVSVNCSAPSACYKAKIKAIVSVSSGFTIETADQGDALKDAELDITVGNSQSCQLACGEYGCKDADFVNIASCVCAGSSCPQPLRKGINYVPNNGMNMNVKHGGSHYPTFLPTAIIVCISIGLICLLSFCIYYKYFTNEEKKLSQYNDNILYNDGNYDTFNKQQSLEMNQI